MYLKLGTIGIKYSSDVGDYIILSEVLDSQISLETPVLVRTPDEFNIWFGKNFEYYDYYISLLQEGITLYLYKPISTEQVGDDYIDINNYIKDNDPTLPGSTIYPNQSYLPKPINISSIDKYSALVGTVKYVWKTNSWITYVASRDGDFSDYTFQVQVTSVDKLPVMPKLGYRYWVSQDENWWIWYEHDWISEDNFLPGYSRSLNNRDTLLITKKEFSKFDYCYPEFNYEKQELGVYSTVHGHYGEQIIDEKEQEKILKNYETLVMIFRFTQDTFEKNSFIVFKDIEGNDNLLYVRDIPHWIDPGMIKYKVSSISDISLVLQTKLGWAVDTVGNELFVYSDDGNFIDCTYYYEFSGLEISPSFENTHNNLSKYVFDNNLGSIEIWSRTIGHTSDQFDLESDITVEIEKSDKEGYYRFIVNRYSYSETFEGPLNPIPGKEERLDNIINKNSKLIYCNFLNNDSELKTGTFTLKRGTTEIQKPKNYIASLKELFNLKGESIYPDYYLVEDINKYSDGLSRDLDYYPVYDTFVKYAKDFNCQFLVQNNPSKYIVKEVPEFPTDLTPDMKYTIFKCNGIYKWIKNGILDTITDRETIESAEYGGNYKFNLLEKDNRLVYFYNTMTYYGYSRPGWFVYLEGLFKDIYSMSLKEINYNTPIINPYEEEDIEKRLEKVKSNYLVCNNHIYYYKKYFNGNDYTTTALMRFIIGKLYREIQKNRWLLLGQKNLALVKENIGNILYRVKNNFSIVDKIYLTEFKPDLGNYTLELSFDVYIKDLVNNNINLDITINYNKYE